MRGWDGRRDARRVAWLCTALAVVTAGDVGAGPSRGRLAGAPGMAVGRAIEGALLGLQEPGCDQVFSDFHDAAGRSLQASLDALGVTPEAYVGLLHFYDGSSQRRCASGEALGGTFPGSRVIFVCSLQFFETDRSDKRATETFIIHETLHSLGLGENPPASSEIDWTVMRRCGHRPPVTRGG